jgi:hypothetical protein
MNVSGTLALANVLSKLFGPEGIVAPTGWTRLMVLDEPVETVSGSDIVQSEGDCRRANSSA